MEVFAINFKVVKYFPRKFEIRYHIGYARFLSANFRRCATHSTTPCEVTFFRFFTRVFPAPSKWQNARRRSELPVNMAPVTVPPLGKWSKKWKSPNIASILAHFAVRRR